MKRPMGREIRFGSISPMYLAVVVSILGQRRRSVVQCLANVLEYLVPTIGKLRANVWQCP